MSRRQDIIQHANEEYDSVLLRGQAVRAEILRQQRAALLTVPGAAEALVAYEAALVSAYDAYETALTTSQEELLTADADARAAQADSDAVALETWREATSAADLARRDALDTCRDEYEAAYAAALSLTGSARAQKVTAAAGARDAQTKAANRGYQRATDAAWRSYQASSVSASEDAIAAIEKARRRQEAAADKARTAHERARQLAERGLQRALASEPVASAIQEAFQLRLKQADAQEERDKANVLARMRNALANARLS